MVGLKKSQLLDVINFYNDIQSKGLDVSSLLDAISDGLVRLLSADGAAVKLKESGEFLYRSSSGVIKKIPMASRGLAHKLCSECSQTRQITKCKNTLQDHRVNSDLCRELGVHSILVSPIVQNDEVVGILKIVWKDRHCFSQYDLEFLKLISDHVSLALLRTSMYCDQNLLLLATTDSLTGLGNRFAFMSALRNSNAVGYFAIVIVDMNGLKFINDNYGHEYGDAALIELGNRLRNCTREIDVIARIGGDEFALMISRGHFTEMDNILERLSKTLLGRFVYKEYSGVLSASFGVALFPEDGQKVEELIQLADSRMYTNKRATCVQAASRNKGLDS